MYYTEINHWTGTIWPSPDDISCTRPEVSDISHSVGGTELCRHKAEHFCFYPVTLSVLRQGRALQEGTIPFLTTCIEFHYNSLGETQRQVLHFTQSQCERAVSDFNTHYCWALPFFFFWRRAWLCTWLENMLPIYFLSGPAEGLLDGKTAEQTSCCNYASKSCRKSFDCDANYHSYEFFPPARWDTLWIWRRYRK